MIRHYKFFLLALGVLLFQIAILGQFLPVLSVSLLPAIIFIISLLVPIETALVIAFVVGFIFDISSLARFPLLTVFLLLEVIIVFVSNKKVINFYSTTALFVGICFFAILLKVVELTVYGLGFGRAFVWIAAANIIVALIFAVSYLRIKSPKVGI